MDFRLFDKFLIFICQQQQASKRCFFECDRDVLGLHSSMSLEMFSCVALLVDAGNASDTQTCVFTLVSDVKLVDLNEFYKCLLSEPC
jgi:hypothetical protein